MAHDFCTNLVTAYQSQRGVDSAQKELAVALMDDMEAEPNHAAADAQPVQQAEAPPPLAEVAPPPPPIAHSDTPAAPTAQTAPVAAPAAAEGRAKRERKSVDAFRPEVKEKEEFTIKKVRCMRADRMREFILSTDTGIRVQTGRHRKRCVMACAQHGASVN